MMIPFCLDHLLTYIINIVYCPSLPPIYIITRCYAAHHPSTVHWHSHYLCQSVESMQVICVQRQQNMINHNWSTSVLVLPVMAYPVMKWSLMAHPVMTNPEIMHTISPSTYICSNFPPLTLSTHSMGVLCPRSVIMPGMVCTATQTVWFLASNIWR